MIELMSCPTCGASNRVPSDKVQAGKVPVCGRCKNPLTGPPHPAHVTDDTFADVVERSAVPVLVDMWAPWCGPCRAIAPILDELAVDLAGRLKIAKLNIDTNPATADRFRIQSIPAMLLFKDGEEIDRIIGAMPKSDIRQRLDRFL
jgi:thioredoxin 2